MRASGTSPEIPLSDVVVSGDELDAIEAALRAGRLEAGPLVERFEREFAARLGVAHALATSTCTAALSLAYAAAGIGEGDEVIVPSITFVATAACTVHLGARPVFAEVRGAHDLSLDPDDVAARIGPRTRAVVAMHYGGYRADCAGLRALCDEAGIALIEDSAHAPLAAPAGTAACFSFFANKVLAAGEGGLVATDDHELARRVRDTRSHHRLDELRAALLLARLPKLDAAIATRRALTRRYRERLRGLVTLPYEDADVASSDCYVMPIAVEARDALQAALRERHGVQTSILYPAVHELSAYRERFGAVALARSEAVARTQLCLPLHAGLTEGDQDRVVAAIEAEL